MFMVNHNHVRSTARHIIQLQFDISANALEIRTEKIQREQSDVLLTVQHTKPIEIN
jgi:hypothetical protein